MHKLASASSIFLKNPRFAARSLSGSGFDLWRYRVGSYRIICEIRDAELIVLVIRVEHREKVDD
ncbi:MAG: hypothetical protein CSA81_00865 [Acidobacteria bacterium]|nr:MAG: hypothetical protein CSA81_00865 [Acidobacteriota bacterium]